jgi:hypothetical protein
MTVEELIASLMETGKSDMRVLMYADHGQWPEEVNSAEEMLFHDGSITDFTDLTSDGWTKEEIDKLEKVIVLM